MANKRPEKPNILFIMPDQLRHDFLSCYDAAFIDTPNIDRLASRGVLFSRGYSQHPVCVPARVALMTGLHAMETGVTDNGQFLRPDYQDCGIKTWAETMVDGGYATAAIGKMHFYPWDLRLGFQYRSICEDKRWLEVRDDYWHFLHDRGHHKLHGNEHEGYYENKGAVINKLPYEMQWDHFVGQEAVQYIDHYSEDKPFFMMVGFPGPHCPYDPDQRYVDMIDAHNLPEPIFGIDEDVERLRASSRRANLSSWNGVDIGDWSREQRIKVRQHYAGLVKQIDVQIGEILDALERNGQLDNTVILFSSDHGDYLGDHDMAGKGTFYEASCHVPLLVHLPWADGQATCDDLVCLTDITATSLAFAGIERPAYMHSRVLPDVGLEPDPSRKRIFFAVSGGWGMFDGRYKLAKYQTGDVHLFDLEHDPHEQHNLAGKPEYAAIQAKLDVALTTEVMSSMNVFRRPQRVYQSTLAGDPSFGMEGWQRQYPNELRTASAGD